MKQYGVCQHQLMLSNAIKLLMKQDGVSQHHPAAKTVSAFQVLIFNIFPRL